MTDDPGFRPETLSTYEPTADEVAARARRPVDDALDRQLVPLTRAAAVAADADLQAEFMRLNPELQRRVALGVLEIDALRRQVEQLREERDGWEKIAESRALYAHKQAARMGAHASAPQPTPVSGVPLAATGKASEGAEDGTGIDTRYRGRAEAAEAEVKRLREERDAFRIEGDHGHDDYEDAEDIIRQIAEKRPNQSFDPWASGLCQEFLDRPRRSRATIATIRDRAEAAEAEVQRYREGLRGLLPLAEQLFAMIPRQVWRDSGGDDGQGHYEGDYRQEQVGEMLRAGRALLADSPDGDCEHEWVSARNEAVLSGLICVKCHALAAEPDGGGAK